jgi:cytoskeletal protein RodZ
VTARRTIALAIAFLVMDIGSELRQAREGLGLSLHDLSNRTKIRLSVLRAIESNDFRQLPNDVFTRGFLKLYAREVGVDPAAIAERFDTLTVTGTPDAPEGGPSPFQRGQSSFGGQAESPGTQPVRVVLFSVVLVAIVVAGYLGVQRWRSGQQAAPDQASAPATAPETSAATQPGPAASPVSPATTPVPDTKREPAPPSPPPASTPATAPAATALRVALRATGPCWLAATADGRQVAYRLLNADERVMIEASTEAVLRIGSPGNVNMTINDRPIRPFERPGQPVTLRITPENQRELAP